MMKRHVLGGAFAAILLVTTLAAAPRAEAMIEDCWRQYVDLLMVADNEYKACTVWVAQLMEAGDWWTYFMFQLGIPGGLTACDVEYAIRAESLWFQFLSCSAFPSNLGGGA